MPQHPGEYLLQHLQAGVASSAELQAALGQSQTNVSRYLRQLTATGLIMRIGSTRGARYGLLRPIEGIGVRWPLRRIDSAGRVHMLGTLHSMAADQFYFQPELNEFAYDRVTRGLPYYLQDQRPAGFLGRAVPLRYPELHLPQRVIDWSDDHYLRYLTQRGSDAVGDLILGDQAFDQFMLMQRQRTIVNADEREIRYPKFASEVMAGGLPGSSAHGEHPKFATLIESPSGPMHVLVKFSPPRHTAVGQRWSDLLVTEHIAHEMLAAAGLPAARSRIERYGDRTYLEVERFDRAGVEGRVGVTSLFAIDTEQYGKLDNWIDSATRLRADRRIDPATCELVRLVSTFGALIANTDRHFGNIAFYDTYNGRYSLAPVYDMLPMLFAPEQQEVIGRIFQPPDPTSQTVPVYGRARALAEEYWRRCSLDARISTEFQAICAACGETLEKLPRTGAYAHQETDQPPKKQATKA